MNSCNNIRRLGYYRDNLQVSCKLYGLLFVFEFFIYFLKLLLFYSYRKKRRGDEVVNFIFISMWLCRRVLHRNMI